MVEDTMFSGESKNIEYKVSLPDKSEKYFGGHCCTMRGARAARAEDRGRHSFRRHHRTGAAAHSLPSTGYPRYHARIVVFVAHFEGRADSRHCRYGDRR